jgi:protein-L-isoaspartate(D-aspartate) O-methyltransferase
VRQFDFSAMRAAMVSNQLRTNNVTDPRVLAALGSVPRELFVPGDRNGLAYIDVPIPCATGRALNPPLVTSRLIGAADIDAGERVLLVGSATGYAAALLAQLGAEIVALEEDDTLATHARGALADIKGVTLVTGDLAAGWKDGGPYDVIIIDGAIEEVPPLILDQLRDGGRMTTGIFFDGVTRLASGVKTRNSLVLIPFFDAEVVPLPGFARPKTFSF